MAINRTATTASANVPRLDESRPEDADGSVEAASQEPATNEFTGPQRFPDPRVVTAFGNSGGSPNKNINTANRALERTKTKDESDDKTDNDEPAPDEREMPSAKDIIGKSSVLQNLAAKDKKALAERVGDFEKDPDAARYAVAALDHIQSHTADGESIKVKNEDQIDGYTRAERNDPKSEAKPNTEAGRFKDFVEQGDDALDSFSRPKPKSDDEQRAEKIIDDNAILRNLAGKDRDAMSERVGDIKKDPDAAERAVSVLDHIESHDGDGKRMPVQSEGKIDGYTRADRNDPKSEAEAGTEAGRLKDFIDDGYEALPGYALPQGLPASDLTPAPEKADDEPEREEGSGSEAAEGPLAEDGKRPRSDTRSAEDIAEDNPLLTGLSGNDKEALKERVGNFDTNADAAYRAVAALNHIERFDGEGVPIADFESNDKIDGWTREDRNDPQSEALPDTEAGRFQDFIKDGYSSLKGDSKPDGTPAKGGAQSDGSPVKTDSFEDEESVKLIEQARKKAELPPLSETDVGKMKITVTDKDGKDTETSVSDKVWGDAFEKWEEGIEEGDIKEDDPRAQLVRSMAAQEISTYGAQLPSLPTTEGKTMQAFTNQDFADVLDGDKIGEAVGKLSQSEEVMKELTEITKGVVKEDPGLGKSADELKEFALSEDYSDYLLKLTEDGDGDLAQADFARTNKSLELFDPDAAAELKSSTMIAPVMKGFEEALADPTKVNDENTAAAGRDVAQLVVNGLTGVVGATNRIPGVKDFLDGVMQNKKSAADFGRTMQELGAQARENNGKVSQSDIEKAVGNGKFTDAAEGKDAVKALAGLNAAGVLGGVAAVGGLTAAAYHVMKNGISFDDEPMQQLGTARMFVGFAASLPNFAKIGTEFHGLLTKTESGKFMGLNKSLPELFGNAEKPGSGAGSAADPQYAEAKEKMTQSFREYYMDPKHDNVTQPGKDNALASMRPSDFTKVLDGFEEGRPAMEGVKDGKHSEFRAGAAAGLQGLGIAGGLFSGAAGMAIGISGIQKNIKSDIPELQASSVLGTVGAGLEFVGGVADAYKFASGPKVGNASRIGRFLGIFRAAGAPLGALGGVIQLATVIPEAVLGAKKDAKIDAYAEELDGLLQGLEKDGLLADDGMEKYDFLTDYSMSVGQRDAPMTESVFDYRSEEYAEFDDSLTFFDDHHEDWDGDGKNLREKMDKADESVGS